MAKLINGALDRCETKPIVISGYPLPWT